MRMRVLVGACICLFTALVTALAQSGLPGRFSEGKEGHCIDYNRPVLRGVCIGRLR